MQMTQAPHDGTPAAAAKARARLTLRAVLSLLILGLSLITVGGTGIIAYRRSRSLLTELKQHEFAVNNRAAADEIERMLDEPAQLIFTEYIHRAQLGMLPLHDNLALGREFVERLRARKQLAWISYSDAATGDFTGASRNKNGDLILDRSHPGGNKGESEEVIVGEDGRLSPYHTDLPDAPYDPRKREWYLHAASADTTVWSVPYDFMDGNFGITASRAWHESGSSGVTGVFTVDFFLRDLNRKMGELSREQKDFVCVFQPDGALLCAPDGYLRQEFADTLGSLVKSNPPEDPAADDNGETKLLTVRQDGEQYLVALRYLNTSTGLRCVVASLAENTRVYRDANHTVFIIGLSGLGLLLVALAVGWGIAKRISRPLVILSGDLQKIGHFDLTPGALKKSIFRELQILIESSERMKSGLRSFLHYVPRELVRQLLHSGSDAALGVEPRRLTILFSDIENFTSYSERTPPGEIAGHLSRYFEMLTGAVWKYSGTVDKFIGDGLLAFFNAPLDVPNHETRACEAALAVFDEKSSGNAAAPLPFRTRIGLHTGEVLVGNVGTRERFAYTVLGDAVNAASRIEALNKVYGTAILASGDVREKTGDAFEWRHIDRVAVAGRRGSIEIHELIGAKGKVPAAILRARDLHEQAMQSYFARDIARARELFAGAAAARPADKAAPLMAGRCDTFLQGRPGEDWDGVHIHERK